MKLIKNVSPFGDVDVPMLSRTVEFGEVVEVTDEQAAALLFQPLHWEAADAPAPDPDPIVDADPAPGADPEPQDNPEGSAPATPEEGE